MTNFSNVLISYRIENFWRLKNFSILQLRAWKICCINIILA